MALRIIKAVRDKGTTVHLFARDDDGGKVEMLIPFRPYFFVLEDAVADSPLLTDCEFGDVLSLWGERLRKVYVANPSDVPAARSLFSKSYEADVVYGRRVLLDLRLTAGCDDDLHPAESTTKLKVLHLDIEVYSNNKMPDAAKDKITCWSLTDGESIITAILDDVDFVGEDNGNAVCHFTTEKMLLTLLVDVMSYESADCLTGWNIQWDAEYLEKRCERYKLDWYGATAGSNIFDLLGAYRHLYRRKSYRLKDVVLDEGITLLDEPRVNYAELWEHDKPGLIERNQRHVQWCAAIEAKRGVIDYYWRLKELAGLEDLEGTQYSSVLIETLLMRRANGFILPSRVERHHTVYEGAIVLDAPVGVFDSVADFDMSRFYPYCLLSENLDPMIVSAYAQSKGLTYDTLTAVDWAAYKTFAKDYIAQGKPTVLLGLVRELMAERDRLQKAGHTDKVMAIKGVVNSLYGVFASPYFRLYSPIIPSRITETARTIITSLASEVQKWGIKVLYGDTDSLWVQVPKADLKQLEIRMNSTLSQWGEYSIKLEKYYKRVLFVGAKKKYAALPDDGGDPDITGFEWKRSDASNYTRSIQGDVLSMILEGRSSEVLPYLKAKVLGVKDASLLDISIAKTVTRELGGYADGAQHYIKSLQEAGADVHAGDAVRMVPASNYPHGVAVFQDVGDLTMPPKVDYDKVIDSQIKRKVVDILKASGLSWDEVIGKKRLF